MTHDEFFLSDPIDSAERGDYGMGSCGAPMEPNWVLTYECWLDVQNGVRIACDRYEQPHVFVLRESVVHGASVGGTSIDHQQNGRVK